MSLLFVVSRATAKCRPTGVLGAQNKYKMYKFFLEYYIYIHYIVEYYCHCAGTAREYDGERERQTERERLKKKKNCIRTPHHRNRIPYNMVKQ